MVKSGHSTQEFQASVAKSYAPVKMNSYSPTLGHRWGLVLKCEQNRKNAPIYGDTMETLYRDKYPTPGDILKHKSVLNY